MAAPFIHSSIVLAARQQAPTQIDARKAQLPNELLVISGHKPRTPSQPEAPTIPSCATCTQSTCSRTPSGPFPKPCPQQAPEKAGYPWQSLQVLVCKNSSTIVLCLVSRSWLRQAATATQTSYY
eukprot:4348589-Amphidinium_carterae.1